MNTNTPDFFLPLSINSGNNDIRNSMDIDADFGVDMSVPISALDTRGHKRPRGDPQSITVSFSD